MRQFEKDEKLSHKTLIYMQSMLLRCARTHYLEKDLVKLKNSYGPTGLWTQGTQFSSL